MLHGIQYDAHVSWNMGNSSFWRTLVGLPLYAIAESLDPRGKTGVRVPCAPFGLPFPDALPGLLGTLGLAPNRNDKSPRGIRLSAGVCALPC